jgi:putative ABC transport system substrate-binding protein
VNRRELILLLGGGLAVPRTLRAQQKAMPVIGILYGFSSSNPATSAVTAFGDGLNDTGWVEGQNLAIKRRYAEGHPDRFPALAADLVGRKVDVLVATDIDSVLAAKNATSTIPIVFAVGIDPVELGLVASLARPGGNLTGISRFNVELMPKRLELLCDLVPQVRVIALLADPNAANIDRLTQAVGEAARRKGVRLQVLKASSESEIDAAFASFAQLQVGGLLVGPASIFGLRREQIFALASRYAVPAMYDTRAYVEAGGLISYGPNVAGFARQVGTYVGKILNGVKPADLPVQQPATFELVINLKTAKALGLTIPLSVLARADEVIE